MELIIAVMVFCFVAIVAIVVVGCYPRKHTAVAPIEKPSVTIPGPKSANRSWSNPEGHASAESTRPSAARVSPRYRNGSNAGNSGSGSSSHREADRAGPRYRNDDDTSSNTALLAGLAMATVVDNSPSRETFPSPSCTIETPSYTSSNDSCGGSWGSD